MKLRRLSLQGFKSFADRTELRFHDGITAIVGPNGCGKSNISDAIRWVLGEQRASAIRGAKMEEAIFQGTAQRRAVNRAEVALEFDNEEGRLALPQRQIEIRRTVFREGGSEYMLNRQQTRLRDILDLYRDTGLGANSYTVIEQGMVDAILSERAEERRHMFEEAAGIGRYKDRRKAALRKLEAAEHDLARLEDLVSEVESKVRSLARQRKKAERYTELRARRLALEIAVATMELEEVRRVLEFTTAELASITEDEPGTRAALSAAEAELERRRLESGEAGRMRNVQAQQLEEVARQIAERERELAVADERRTHAERRLAQIALERDELQARAATLESELHSMEQELGGQQGVVEALRGRVADVQERQHSLRQEVTEVRRADEEARARENDLTRQLARLEAEAAGADQRMREAEARIEHVLVEREQLDAELSRLDQQRDLFAEQARELGERIEALRVERDGAAQRLERLREAAAEARRAQATAEDAANRLASQAAALEALVREHHGFAPAVAAALNARERLPGLAGPVAEFLSLDAERAAALEASLGSLLQMLVVQDAGAAAELRRWLEEQQQRVETPAPGPKGRSEPAKGTVAFLPREALPRLESLVEALEFSGSPASEPVLIGRRQKLEKLRREAEAAQARAAALAHEREGAEARVAEAESRLREVGSAVETTELELRRAQADEVNRSGQRGRADRARVELVRRHEDLLALVERTQGEAVAARQQRSGLESQLGEHRAGWQHATSTLAEREAAWEAVREEEAELRVGHARAEGALAALERRIAGTREDLGTAAARLGSLDAEEAEHRASLERLAGVSSGAGQRLEQLFRERDTLAMQVRVLDERLAEAGDAALELETRVRALRRAADERGESRHRLELQRAEAVASERRVRERLEAEWGRPFEQLVEMAEPAAGEPEPLRAELNEVAADIERLGPINMLAMEEYEEESQRLDFLQSQKNDLTSARDDLQSAIRQINRTARDLFTETFGQIRENFHRTFHTLFEGGECDIRLEDPEDPLESPIDIMASPKGKKTQRIHLLSGGERALTALSLLFAIYLVKPSPFCVLDEVDAPLDEVNIGRFIGMLQEFKRSTQFVVITHNPRTMESADWLYGVTMEEPGISSIVGVRMDDVVRDGGAAGAGEYPELPPSADDDDMLGTEPVGVAVAEAVVEAAANEAGDTRGSELIAVDDDEEPGAKA
jgi:chromosome segregation protein